MLYRILIILLAISVNLMAVDGTSVQTVDNVDLHKYTGKWYEIAKIPNNFQKDCVSDTVASYEIRDDGRISVVNKCLANDGRVIEVDGIAKVADKDSKARLRVSFFSILGWHLFWGDYWIIGLGEDYDYAIVGHPERKYGWILSRSTKLSEEKMNEIFTKLENNGYDPYKFVFTKQNTKD